VGWEGKLTFGARRDEAEMEYADAARSLQESYDWYEKKPWGLGEEF
jgi:hypothetical protein